MLKSILPAVRDYESICTVFRKEFWNSKLTHDELIAAIDSVGLELEGAILSACGVTQFVRSPRLLIPEHDGPDYSPDLTFFEILISRLGRCLIELANRRVRDLHRVGYLDNDGGNSFAVDTDLGIASFQKRAYRSSQGGKS